jgi:hypothetical protein
MTLLLASLALADTTASTFDEDDGGWAGGTVESGVLTVTDGAVTLSPGRLANFRLAARVRLVDGARLSFSAGDATLAATYGEGGILSLGTPTGAVTAAALPPFEQSWQADDATTFSGASPELVSFGGGWLLYRELDGVIYAATSPDGDAWTDAGAVLTGTDPAAVDEGGTLAVYYGCAGAICRATSFDGLTFVSAGTVLAASGPVTVAESAAGGWRAWYAPTPTDGTWTATSADGRTWTTVGLVADTSRLVDADVAVTSAATASAWSGPDGIYSTFDAPDADLSDGTADRGPLFAAGSVAWCPDVPASPALALEGYTWHLWVECAGAIGHLRGVPEPGGWVGLVAEWDGATLTTSWSGATLTTALTGASVLSLAAEGVLELDEAQVTYLLATDDTGGADDTGDTGDTGDVEQIDPDDTADTDVVTGETDTAVTADTGTDGALAYNASELTGETGGWGCETATAPGFPAWILALALLFRRHA